MKQFKKITSIYLILTFLGMLLIGLGTGISVFELSTYQGADYYNHPDDPSLPDLHYTTITFEAKLAGGAPFKLDTADWNFQNGYDIQYNNALMDKVLIKLTAPKDFYDIYLHSVGEQSNNHYCLECDSSTFQELQFMLQLIKEGYIPESKPAVTCTLIMSEEQAKQFQLNEERNRANQLKESMQEEIRAIEQNYENTLAEVQQEYSQQTDILIQQHAEELEQLQQQYDNQLELKDEELAALQEQLESIRNSLQ